MFCWTLRGNSSRSVGIGWPEVPRKNVELLEVGVCAAYSLICYSSISLFGQVVVGLAI